MHKNHIYILLIVGLVGLLGYQVWNITADNSGASSDPNEIVMYKNEGCQCCTKWGNHMEQAGFTVTEQPTERLAAIKMERGVPYTMGSCHTAIVNGYVIEGHVPVADVKRLLEEQPEARGLAVPNMPAGSPGMESPNPEPYNVYLIGKDGNSTIYSQQNTEQNADS